MSGLFIPVFHLKMNILKSQLCRQLLFLMQLVLATSASGGSAAPSIVNDNNMKLLFQIQKKVGNSHDNKNFGTASAIWFSCFL